MTAPRRLQLRRGNTAATSTYVGAPGELVVNTTTNTLYLHDGSTVGGYATTSNITAINNQISSVNANITLANTGMQGYVNLANTIQSAQLTSANLGIIGYVDLANTIQSAQVGAANLAITAANLGMKGYVDSVASQSIYGNGNVKSYLTAFNGSIIPSANVTYDLGDNTHRWKDLYLSGNTITLGDATISAIDGKLVTTGAAISPPTGAVGFANLQYEAPTDFSTVYDFNKSLGHRYTANLTTYSSAPIIWDELRTLKLQENSYIVQGYTPSKLALDTLGGRFANAVATLDATGNIAGITITDGGVGYDAYYPYYATDPTGYAYYDEYRQIGLIPTTASDVGNITSMGTLTRGASAPTVGPHTYTWIGNSGSNVSITINWSSNTVSSYTYTPALPTLTSANDWQNWLLDYQNTNEYGWYIGSTSGSGSAIKDYLNREALPYSLRYDIANNKWYPNGLNVNNSAQSDSISGNSFTISFNTTAIGYATLENSYSNPVYWLRGLTADSGISTAGDMTVAGDLRVAGDLYVSPTSIYMGNLRISAADGNLTVNTGIKFSDGSVQSSSYSNVQVATYLTANPPAGSYSNVQVGVFTNLSNYAYNANVTAANVGLKGYVDSQSFYSNAKVATYLPTYSGNISANISKAGYTWTFGADGTTSFPNSLILAPASQSITMQSDQYSQLMWENANLTVAPNMAINSNFYVAQNNATLDIGYRDGSSTQLIKSWYWNVDGNLKLPSGGYILNSDDSIYGAGGSYSNVQVAAYLNTQGYNLYSNVNVASYLSTATITTTGNITAQNLIGNISITGNVTGTSANVTLQAGSFSSTFDNQGNVRLPTAYVTGNVIANYFIGNGSQLTGLNTLYLLEAYASETYTLPGSFTEDPCRYSYISNTVNVSSAWFNTSTYTFTPQKAGYWEITAAYDVYRNTEASLAIKKNNSIVASAGSFNAVAQQITKIIYFNGSTDSANIINAGGASLSRSQYETRSWFQARWIGA